MKFSVLMSLYAKEKAEYLQQCLLSLTQQTLLADEIVLVFDGEIGDDLQQIVHDFEDKLPFKIVKLEKNVGLGQALNLGLAQCCHDWVFRMDTDDICLPNRFEKQMDFIQNNPEISVVGGQIIEFKEKIDDSQTIKQVPILHEQIVKYAKSRNPINHMTVAFRKSVVVAVGNYRHAPLYEDYDLWVRLLIDGQKFANLPDVLVYARAGNAMYERRGGWDYAKNEWVMQKSFYQLGFLTRLQMLKNLIIRLPVRLLPNTVRACIYQVLLRK